MKITPAIANPALPLQPDRKAARVDAVRPARDPADEDVRQPQARRPIDEALRAAVTARAEVVGAPVRVAGTSAVARRALASYEQVADQGDRESIRQLLGFDDYA